MKIIAFDTSGLYLNSALVDTENNVEFIYENNQENTKSHSINLLGVIENLLSKAVWSFSDVQRIVITKGPGSFTGLRIGATVAKILAEQLNVDLVAVSTLESIYKSNANINNDDQFIPIIDARNNNVFGGVYQNGKNIFKDGHYEINSLTEKFPDAIFILDEAASQNSFPDLKNKIIVKQNKLVDPVVLAKIGEFENPVDPVTFSPEYLRKTQAEMKWLEDNQKNEKKGGDDVFLV